MSVRQRKRNDEAHANGLSPEKNTEEMGPPQLLSPDSKLGLFSLLGFFIAFCQVFCEVIKQVSNYSLQYYNGGRYPIPQTVMVVLMEVIKLLTTIIRSKGSIPSFSIPSLRSSLRFLVPSILYALNNNIYFIGLTLVPPPIWLILCSFRTVVTASIYKFYLRRQVTPLQFLGAFFIVVSIAIAKAPDIVEAYVRMTTSAPAINATLAGRDVIDEAVSTVNALPVAAIVLAMIASCNSVGAAVYTESLFKGGSNKGENFLHQQFWLYLYGGLVASIVHFATHSSYTTFNLYADLTDMSGKLQILLLVALLFGSLGGLVVAAILKLLDNIVKEYTGSFANILTGVACSFLFPDKFAFTIYIVFSMCSLLSGIYLYETKKVVTKSSATKS